MKDYIHLHFIILLWGFTAVVGKITTMPAMELVLYRSIIAVIGLTILMFWYKQQFQIGTKAILAMVATGSLTALHWILFFGSAKVSTISVCLAGISTTSLWTSIIEPIVMRRAVRWYEVLLGLIIIAGLYLIFRFQFNYIVGLLMAVASAVFVSMFSVINGKLASRYHHITISLYEMLGAALCTAIFLPFYLQSSWAESSEIYLLGFAEKDWGNWVGVFFLGVVCTVYAYAACVEIMQRVSPFAVNLSVNMEPVYGIIIAAVWFGEYNKMTAGFYGGAGIILLSVFAYPLLKSLDKKWAAKQASA